MTTRALAAGPRAAAWDATTPDSRFVRAKILVTRTVLPILGVARTLHETIEASMINDDRSISPSDREELRRLVTALKTVESIAERLKKRWGW